MDKDYRNPKWKKIRENVISRDDYTCCRCQKKEEVKNLRVHHKIKYPNKKYWDYPLSDLETLCKSCLAEIYKKIIPQSGWEYLGAYDLEDLSGSCELCGTDIRYEHSVFHPEYGELTVGCDCADRLTQTSIASKWDDERKKYKDKLNRFIKSTLWKEKTSKNGNIFYKRSFKGCELFIWDNGGYYKLWLKFFYFDSHNNKQWDTLKGKIKYLTLDEAKVKLFETITNGSLKKYILNHFGTPIIDV